MINTNSGINNSVGVMHPGSSQLIKTNPYAELSSSRADESPSSVVTISPEAKLANIAARYDVTNISPNEVKEMAKELYDNNLISEKEALLLYIPSSIDENPNQKYNYLDGRHKDLAAAIKTGYVTQKNGILEKNIEILEHLKTLSHA